MIATAWNNGKYSKTGSGYGLKIDINDRNKNFSREWKNIILYLEGIVEPLSINIDKPSFWNQSCRELINKEIGKWLIKNNKAPWPKNNPPKIKLEKIENNIFKTSFIK